ncbi:hypothetical protein [uncultured Vagococcus sp.]|uniref:hypothetical protein n=1 Tax=uncultured Vagococcus sp. TaxID=189676 RepID=UPI0028D85F77|nr:hypothetical protein [uncultured Vagococcus sp.]
MCQKLQEFLKENKANFLLKYDSIRENNKYTVMLFDTVKKEKISGGDTNSIDITEESIENDTNSHVDFYEINNLLYKIQKSLSAVAEYVVMISINYVNGDLKYTFYLDELGDVRHNKFRSYKELVDFIGANYE